MLTNLQRRVRLILQDKLNNTEIAKLTACSRNTVASWRKSIAKLENPQEQLVQLDDTALRQLITPGAIRRSRAFVTPDFDHIAFECAERGVQIKTLFEEYRDKVPVGQQPMARSTFYRAVEEHLEKKNVVMSFEYAPGEMFQCDFVGRKKMKQPALVASDGQPMNYELFCAVSAQSRKIYLVAIESQAKLPSLDAFSRMLAFFGGVPVLVTIDNFPAAVAKPRKGQAEATLTPEFQDLADTFGFSLIAARVRKPRDKGLVENAVGIVQNDVLAKLRNRRFFSLAEMNTAISEHLSNINYRPMPGHQGLSREDLFTATDAIGLKALPNNAFAPGQWLLKVRVGHDYHVYANGNRYSVPARYAGKTVDVKVTSDTVHIHRNGKTIATHRKADRPGEKITRNEHMPKAHRDVALTRLVGIKRSVQEIGPDAEQLIEMHYRSRRSPSATANLAVRLRQLTEQYSAERVNEACRRASLIGKRTVQTVENILSGGLDVIDPAVLRDQSNNAVATANIRGSAYFAAEMSTSKEGK